MRTPPLLPFILLTGFCTQAYPAAPTAADCSRTAQADRRAAIEDKLRQKQIKQAIPALKAWIHCEQATSTFRRQGG